MMKYLLLILAFLFVVPPNADSQPKNGRLSIQTTGQATLPADQVEFNITVNAEADSPQKAFRLHQKREKALVHLLKQYDIKEKNIHYQPVSIRKEVSHRNSRPADTSYVTHQSVRLSLTDFDAFENIQIGLINHHYDNFNAHFSSTKMEDGKDKALKAALDKAKEKAQLIAGQMGIKLGTIKKIDYGIPRYHPQPGEAYKSNLSASQSGSLSQYDQTVTVTASVSVDYALSK